MIHNEHGLMVFVDAQPTEQLQDDENTVICIAGSLCLAPEGLPGLSQYKATPAQDRPDAAEALADFLKQNDTPVRAAAVIARSMDFARYGDQLVETLPDNVLRQISPERYRVDDGRLNANLVLALPMYATAICLIGLRAAIWAQSLEQTKVTLVLDLLPSDPTRALELVRRLSHHPDLFPMWKETMESFGVDICITNIASYVDDAGTTLDGKYHPCGVIADWLAHSIYAATATGETLDQGAVRTEAHRRAITQPFFALHERERIRLIPTNRLITQRAHDRAKQVMTPARAAQLLEEIEFADRMCRLLFRAAHSGVDAPSLEEQLRFVSTEISPILESFLVEDGLRLPSPVSFGRVYLQPTFVTDEFRRYTREIADALLTATQKPANRKVIRSLATRIRCLLRDVLIRNEQFTRMQ